MRHHESSVAGPPPAGHDPGRHHLVDILRGVSLLGILLVNIEFIVQHLDIGWLNHSSGADRIVQWLIITFGQAKVYPLFALLFGYGITVQLRNAERRNEQLGARFLRRLIGIALLGVVHGVLFFPGDILVIYAAVGALAYRFRYVDSSRLARWAVVTYGLAAVVWLGLGLLDTAGATSPTTVDPASVEVFRSGSFDQVVAERFWYWPVVLAILSAVQGPAVFAFVLAGIALGRTNLLSHPADHRLIARRVLRWAPLGVALAGLGATLTTAGGRVETLGFAVGFVAAPVVTAGYIATAALVAGRSVPSKIVAPLEASGRMSLTVYLMESVVVSTLAYGYGFGLFGRIGPAAGAAIAITVWAGLCLCSIVWLKAARMGPFEWALRFFTYGRRPPLRR